MTDPDRTHTPPASAAPSAPSAPHPDDGGRAPNADHDPSPPPAADGGGDGDGDAATEWTADVLHDMTPQELAQISDYLTAQRATLLQVDGCYALSVHGAIEVDGLSVPYHLIPDDGFLSKANKWRRMDRLQRVVLVRTRWNDEARGRLEAELSECVRGVVGYARSQALDPWPALHALQAKYELARLRCIVARERIEAARTKRETTRQAEQTRDAVNLALYPESFTVAQSMRRHFIAVLGPTNSGKTHMAMEHLARAESGVYLAPLRLLALENYNRLRAAGVAVSMITGEQRKLHPQATHIASTVEMLNTGRIVDVAVIDEIQLLDDPDRGAAWTAAVCGVPARTVYLLGAPEAKDAVEALVHRVGGTLEVRQLERMSPLSMEKKPLGSLRNLQAGDMLIAFSRRDVLNWRDQVVELGFSVSAIYGNLSPEVRQSQAERFLTGETQIVVGTDAIGMGLNTPARRVIFTTSTKWDGDAEGVISAALARQIAGRAGRYGEHAAGLVAGLDDDTHRMIATLLRQRPEPLPTTGFYVAPSLDYLQQISRATGITRLHALLELFTKHINVHDEFFLPANLNDQLDHARFLDQLQLTLEDRYTLSLCPVSTKIPMLEAALHGWAESRARGLVVPLRQLENPSGKNPLQFLEDSCKLYSAYAWLGFRMSDTFPDQAIAQDLMASSSEQIDRLLQAQNSQSRRSNRPALGGGRGGRGDRGGREPSGRGGARAGRPGRSAGRAGKRSR